MALENPFDKQTDPQMYAIFERVVPHVINQINAWLLKEYPKFDIDLTKKIEQLDKAQNQARLFYHNIQVTMEEENKKAYERHKVALEEFINKKFPEIKKTLQKSCTNFDKMMETYKEKHKQLDETLKKVDLSASLYEDVYKLRDQMKEIDKFMKEFKTKVKKAFEI
jgi:hypothetical protein